MTGRPQEKRTWVFLQMIAAAVAGTLFGMLMTGFASQFPVNVYVIMCGLLSAWLVRGWAR